MGGSVIVRASGPLLSAKYKISGVAVLDVVEGMGRGYHAIFEGSPHSLAPRVHFGGTSAHAQSP